MPMTAGTTRPDGDGMAARARPLRADAERNRAAILAAARRVFAEQGLAAPLEEIATRAGVGIGTLYRRFPTREQLVAAALTDKFAQYAEAAGAALALPDPWLGFTSFVDRICELQAADRGLSDLLSIALPAGDAVSALRQLANARVAELVRRAKAAGALRPDFVPEDLLLLLFGQAAVVHVTEAEAPGTWRRFAALALDGFAGRAAGPLPAPPSREQLTRAMQQLALRKRGHWPRPRAGSAAASGVQPVGE
jgi:AcrR family transcriptional regulator